MTQPTPAAPEGQATPTLTLNDLAAALFGVMHAQTYWQKEPQDNRFAKSELAKFKTLNEKLSAILDRFELPADADGERPDNGDDTITLIWERTAKPPAAAPDVEIEALLEAFDKAAQSWGYEDDQGTTNVDASFKEYQRAKATLEIALSSMAQREQAARQMAWDMLAKIEDAEKRVQSAESIIDDLSNQCGNWIGEHDRVKDRAEKAEAELDRVKGELDRAYYVLATGGEDDAGYNLQGALDDLVCNAATRVTERTIERVFKQIVAAQDILTAARAKPQTDEGADKGGAT
jgi:hypothetical protein